MSEEEKKAIHKMKRLLSYSKEHEYFSPFQEQEIDDMDIVLKLVENQQKEIEELKEKNIQLTNYLNDSYYVSADKIREKIKEYQEKYNNYPNNTPEHFEFRQEYLHKFRVLEELLEENNNE